MSGARTVPMRNAGEYTTGPVASEWSDWAIPELRLGAGVEHFGSCIDGHQSAFWTCTDVASLVLGDHRGLSGDADGALDVHNKQRDCYGRLGGAR